MLYYYLLPYLLLIQGVSKVMQPVFLSSVLHPLTAQKCQCKHWSSQCSKREWDLVHQTPIFTKCDGSLCSTHLPECLDLMKYCLFIQHICVSVCLWSCWTNTFVGIILHIRPHNKYMFRNAECHFETIWTDAVLATSSIVHHKMYQ